MAGANLPARKYSKKTPTVTRLSFEMSGNATQFLDIGKALSIINRRFYRAGLFYYVNSIEVYNNEQGVVDLHTLPDTWVTKNAWNRGFQIYNKMNRLVGPPSTRAIMPPYHDFKVYMNDLHRQTGSEEPNLHGVNASTLSMAGDEWEYSQFVSADSDGDIDVTNPVAPEIHQEADNFYVHMLGPHIGSSDNWTSIGLIASYGDSRGTVDDSAPTFDHAAIKIDPLINLFDYSTEEQLNDIIENLSNLNDEPPYDGNDYIGAEVNHMQHVARVGTEVGLGRVGRASGFCAPFGLICVDPQGISSAFRVVLNLAVGTYHGVYAERA